MTTAVKKHSSDISMWFGVRVLGLGSHFCNLIDVQPGEESLTFSVLVSAATNGNNKNDASWLVSIFGISK